MDGPALVLSRPRVGLTSDFQLVIDDTNVAVPHGVQRLVAFLALAAHPVSRSHVAGELWLDVPEWRALGNLRSALWRLRRIPQRIVRSIDERLTLEPDVEVDLVELTRLSDDLVSNPDDASLARLPELVAASDVLPGWDDEWLILGRERFRELRLHALEAACRALLRAGDAAGALQAAIAAVGAEPFRDSAQRLLVSAHLQEGNTAAALRAFRAYRDLMEMELGIGPSDAMEELVASFMRPS